MLYRPEKKRECLWDTLLFRDGDEYHLFHCLGYDNNKTFPYLGHLTSPDLLNWTRLGNLRLTSRRKKDWDYGDCTSGMIVKHQGKYYNFHGAIHNGVQLIGVSISDDLVNWKRYPGNPVLKPDPRWYETKPDPSYDYPASWCDPFVFYDEGEQSFYAYICARTKDGPFNTRGCIAAARSKDLLGWEVLPPIAAPQRYFRMELPVVCRISGRYYLVFCASTPRIDTSGKERAIGMFYGVSDNIKTGYDFPKDNLVLGASGRISCYGGRCFEDEDGTVYLYHHLGEFNSAFSFPKLLVSENGKLTAKLWPKVESLVDQGSEYTVAQIGAPLCPNLAFRPDQWMLNGSELISDAGGGYTAMLVPGEFSSFYLHSRVRIDKGNRAGFFFHWDEARKKAYGLILDAEHKRVEFTRVAATMFGYTDVPIDEHTFPINPRQTYDLKLFVNKEFVEAYIDDICVLATTTPDTRSVPLGGLGLLTDQALAVFDSTAIRELNIPTC